jgi:predicted nucleotidyltransferase
MSRNIQQLCYVAEALEELVHEVVFLGGCTTALMVEELAAAEARATEDVDFIVDLTAWVEYNRLVNQLKSKGFYQSMDDTIICRMRCDFNGIPLIVDVMPTDESILGFSNPWYAEAFKTSHRVNLPNGIEIRIPPPLLFLATKLCAWNDRGKGDVFLSQDLEDIVYVLENRPRLPIEFREEDNEAVKAYIAQESKNLLANVDFLSYLPGTARRDSRRVINCLEFFSRHN